MLLGRVRLEVALAGASQQHKEPPAPAASCRGWLPGGVGQGRHQYPVAGVRSSAAISERKAREG